MLVCREVSHRLHSLNKNCMGDVITGFLPDFVYGPSLIALLVKDGCFPERLWWGSLLCLSIDPRIPVAPNWPCLGAEGCKLLSKLLLPWWRDSPLALDEEDVEEKEARPASSFKAALLKQADA